MPAPTSKRRHITFVSGTRADLNLLLPTLAALRAHPRLKLSLIATGMHLSTLPAHGGPLSAFRAANLKPDLTVPWPPHRDLLHLSEITLTAAASLARAYRKLRTEAVLVLGDRVEAYAAASAAHLAHLPLAHIHGGDRAEGQLDDALRHAISQLAHLHLAASPDSAARLLRLGQAPHTVHTVGAPGVQNIRHLAAPKSEILARFPNIASTALVLLHPTTPNAPTEHAHALRLLSSLRAHLPHILLLPPNTDPGHDGILSAWKSARTLPNVSLLSDLPRPIFLGLLRDCRLLAGNSSAGIIEAASFSTPVLNVGTRQSGRLAPPNVSHATFSPTPLRTTIRDILKRPKTTRSNNPYARPNTANRISTLLASPLLASPPPPKRLAH